MQPPTGTVTLEKLAWPRTYQYTEGLEARIRKDSLKVLKQQAQKRQHEMQRRSKEMKKAPAVTPQITYAWGRDRWPHRLAIQLSLNYIVIVIWLFHALKQKFPLRPTLQKMWKRDKGMTI